MSDYSLLLLVLAIVHFSWLFSKSAKDTDYIKSLKEFDYTETAYGVLEKENAELRGVANALVELTDWLKRHELLDGSCDPDAQYRKAKEILGRE